MTEEEEDLDLTGERAAAPGLAGPHARAYDPFDDREKKRGIIALSLVGILGLIVLAALSYVFFAPEPDPEAMKALLEILFTPMVGLVGAVTGFYFGEKQAAR